MDYENGAELHPEKWIMKMELSYIKDKEQRF
jgi:hypothetical protein